MNPDQALETCSGSQGQGGRGQASGTAPDRQGHTARGAGLKRLKVDSEMLQNASHQLLKGLIKLVLRL